MGMTNDQHDAFMKTVKEIKSNLVYINASLEAVKTNLTNLKDKMDTEESLLKTLQDEITREIDREVIKQMILNDPGSKECKALQKKNHIQEIKDAAKEYEL